MALFSVNITYKAFPPKIATLLWLCRVHMLGFMTAKWLWYALACGERRDLLGTGWARNRNSSNANTSKTTSQNLSHGKISYPYPFKIPLAYRPLAKSLWIKSFHFIILGLWGIFKAYFHIWSMLEQPLHWAYELQSITSTTMGLLGLIMQLHHESVAVLSQT